MNWEVVIHTTGTEFGCTMFTYQGLQVFKNNFVFTDFNSKFGEISFARIGERSRHSLCGLFNTLWRFRLISIGKSPLEPLLMPYSSSSFIVALVDSTELDSMVKGNVIWVVTNSPAPVRSDVYNASDNDFPKALDWIASQILSYADRTVVIS